MKAIILFRGEFEKDITFDTILYDLGIPERQRKNIKAIKLRVDSCEIV